MNTENQIIDYKSIRKIRTGDKGFKDLAERLPDVERAELQKMLYSMVGNEIKTTGGRTYRKYELK